MSQFKGEQGQAVRIVSLQYAGRSDRGSRLEQQDAFGLRYLQRHEVDQSKTTTEGATAISCDAELLAVLADGMGGHAGGSVASRTSCDCFISSYQNLKGDFGVRLLHALDASNKAVAHSIEAEESLRGMGCTLLAVSVSQTGVRWISVGDSLLYLYRDGALQRLNEDHSLAPILDELAEQGEMSASEAGHHPKRSMLRSAVTGSDIELVDLGRDALALQSGDWLILASDGLLTLSPERIGEIIEQQAPSGADSLTERLIEAIRQQDDPEQDNTTILTIGYSAVTSQ